MTQSVAGVLIKDGRLLLARRKPGGDMGGRWELPGGKVEGNESLEEALGREFMEEFGLVIKVGQPCAEARFRHHGKDHLVTAYLIGTDQGFGELAEHDEIAWFGRGGLPERRFLVDSDADLIAQILALAW
jgi:8-oxo-dGTP diphosphatase